VLARPQQGDNSSFFGGALARSAEGETPSSPGRREDVSPASIGWGEETLAAIPPAAIPPPEAGVPVSFNRDMSRPNLDPGEARALHSPATYPPSHRL